MFLISEETGWKIAGILFVNFTTYPVILILANIFLIRAMITVFETNGNFLNISGRLREDFSLQHQLPSDELVKTIS